MAVQKPKLKRAELANPASPLTPRTEMQNGWPTHCITSSLHHFVRSKLNTSKAVYLGRGLRRNEAGGRVAA